MLNLTHKLITMYYVIVLKHYKSFRRGTDYHAIFSNEVLVDDLANQLLCYRDNAVWKYSMLIPGPNHEQTKRKNMLIHSNFSDRYIIIRPPRS